MFGNWHQDVVELAGYTERVAMLMVVLDDCSKGKYVRSSVESERQQASLGLVLGPGGAPLANGVVAESDDGAVDLADVSKTTNKWSITATVMRLKSSCRCQLSHRTATS